MCNIWEGVAQKVRSAEETATRRRQQKKTESHFTNSACGHVGRNHDGDSALAKLVHDKVTLTLGLIAVNGHRGTGGALELMLDKERKCDKKYEERKS